MPALFQGVGEVTPEREVTHLSVKQAGLALPDPTKTESCVITEHIVTVLRGQEEFRTADHTAYLREGR